MRIYEAEVETLSKILTDGGDVGYLYHTSYELLSYISTISVQSSFASTRPLASHVQLQSLQLDLSQLVSLARAKSESGSIASCHVRLSWSSD